MKSQIDPNQFIRPEEWVVSLLSKPRGRNPEHAFIILEGIENHNGKDCIVFFRYDFVTPYQAPNASSTLPCFEPVEEKIELVKQRDGRVNIREHGPLAGNDGEENNRYFWTAVMKDLEQEQGFQGCSWTISRAKAGILQRNVAESQLKPPKYQIKGRHAMFAASSSQTGDNCFTWARNQLLQLEVEVISNDSRLKLKFIDFLAARTTRHLAEPQQPNSNIFCNVM